MLVTNVLEKIFCTYFNKDLKLLYHKTGENLKNIECLNGNPFHESIRSIIEDLQSFQDPATAKIVKQLICELEFTYTISRLQVVEEGYCDKIFEKFQKLSIPTHTEKSFMILPAGYRSKDAAHAALYVIERHNDGRYSFFVVNTGNGLKYLKYSTTLDKDGIAYLPDQLAKDNKDLAASYRYTNLTKESFTLDFFNVLLKHYYKPSMQESQQHIHDKLGLNNNFEYYTAHEVQTHGTCSMRCLFAFLSIQFDITTSKKFYKHVLDREINKFKNKPFSLFAIPLLFKSKKSMLDKLIRNAEEQKKKLESI
jgi:hypothetical protein